MDQITKYAKAKINLGLDVIRRRPDGYHEVKMIMQTVGIWDVLRITKASEAGIRITANDTAKNDQVPIDQNNLIYKAASMLMNAYPDKIQGVQIHLDKNIPVAAGMAGGSTDAAATFTGMNELFDLKLTMQELMAMAVNIGADVPYCILGGTALSEGIGEILTPIMSPPQCYLVIAKPDLFISTKYVYENLKLTEDTRHPDIDGIHKAIENQDLDVMAEKLENLLETVTETEYPVIATLKEMMKQEGALNALMSGSGPTVFGIFKSKGEAEQALNTVRGSGLAKQVFLTTFA